MKIFASDYDGTIKVNGKVSQRNIDAISKWVEAGNLFGLVSGRSMETMMQEIEEYQFPAHFIICNNGGVIYDQELHLLKLYEMDFEVALELIEEIRKMHCNSFILNNGYYRAKEMVDSDQVDLKYGRYTSDLTIEKVLEEKHIAQIIISLNDNEYGKKIAKEINEKYAGKVSAFPNTNCVDIVPYGVDKAQGLSFIETYYGFNHEDIYCMGDAFNDLPMLKKFNSATLFSAFEEVKSECEVIVEDVAEFLLDAIK